MIAACIDRMKRDACGGCERRDACSSLFAGLFGPGGAFAGQPERRAPPAAAAPNPFLAFLGRLAREVEAQAAEARMAGAARRAAAAPAEPGLRAEVERLLEPMLEAGDVRIDAAARALGLSRQTLYRRLKAEGVTFEELLDGLRRRLALRYLREEGLSVKETAYRLGFSDPAAFSRAFKRWTGSSPRSARP